MLQLKLNINESKIFHLYENNGSSKNKVLISNSELIITINVPLFKKLRDIIFFCGTNFMSHFKGHFEGAKTFLTP